jgi:hypothetical protein
MGKHSASAIEAASGSSPLLTKRPTRTSGAFRFYGICRQKRADERTQTAYPCSSYE